MMLDYHVLIKPSNKLREYLELVNKDQCPRTETIKSLPDDENSTRNEFLRTIKDSSLLSNNILKNENVNNSLLLSKEVKISAQYKNNFLCIEDLLLLNKELENHRNKSHSIYLHELLEGSSIYLTENKKLERNPELEKRCTILKAQQENLRYRFMAKNVDNNRLQESEETLSYQMKQINNQLIAVGQFVISSLAGFAFGFIGIDLLIGSINFGVRLLLGIICAVIIGIAELYFLSKQLVD